MQAAANRLAGPTGNRRRATPGAHAHVASTDDAALLGALPIAAAVVGLTSSGILRLVDRNRRFDEVIALTGDTAMMAGDFRQCTHLQIAQLMLDFLADFGSPSELDFCDGEGFGARHFRIKLAPLQPDETNGRPRCLVCLVDRSVEVQAERTLRAEMLRDSLTGLPNRLAFTEAIEQAGAKNARDVDHAVLVVDMLRFSRINESMGSLAGDELLITFARRLILALRAGDVLARTGGNEFGVLVSLKRGVEDAL